MTPLRQKMIKAMELRNLAANTQKGYLGVVLGAPRDRGSKSCGPVPAAAYDTGIVCARSVVVAPADGSVVAAGVV